MKKLTFVFIWMLSVSASFGQIKNNNDDVKIKTTIINFLEWYKSNGDKLYKSPIILGFNQDTIKKGTIVSIDMKAVDDYLENFNKPNYVSKTFLNELRQTYKSVSDTLLKYPLIDYFGPIGGLEADLIFGFEPEEILDHIKEGKFTKIYTVYDKAIVKFDISKINQYIFIMTRVNNKWLIDYFGLDRTSFDKIQK
jgi:hypothetical protein